MVISQNPYRNNFIIICSKTRRVICTKSDETKSSVFFVSFFRILPEEECRIMHSIPEHIKRWTLVCCHFSIILVFVLTRTVQTVPCPEPGAGWEQTICRSRRGWSRWRAVGIPHRRGLWPGYLLCRRGLQSPYTPQTRPYHRPRSMVTRACC